MIERVEGKDQELTQDEGHYEGRVGLRGLLGVRVTQDPSGCTFLAFFYKLLLKSHVKMWCLLVLYPVSSYFLLFLADLIHLCTRRSHLG